MAKNNHNAAGFKGSTHSISYNVRTTTCTVLACAAQADTTPMQKPDSVTGQARLSSKVLTAHNILLPAGVISQSIAVIVPIVFRLEHTSFYPKIAIISCFRTAVLLRTKSKTHNFVIFYFVMPWCTSTRIEAQPELSTRQQQHRQQSSRRPARVCLQDSKTERSYKYT